MTNRTYYAPQGGLPPQTALLTDRAVFTESYAVIPKGVLRDITVSYFPFWEKTRAWVLSRPLSGFAETFSQYIMDVKPEGGSDKPEPDAKAEGVLFVVEGELSLTLAGKIPCDAARRLCLYSTGGEVECEEQERETGEVSLDPQGLRLCGGARYSRGLRGE